MPDFSAAAVAWCAGDGAEHVDVAFKPEQPEKGEDQCFLVIDGLLVGDNHLMTGMMLNALDEIMVMSAATSDQHLSFRQTFN